MRWKTDKIAACARVIADKKGKLVSLQNTNLVDISDFETRDFEVRISPVCLQVKIQRKSDLNWKMRINISLFISVIFVQSKLTETASSGYRGYQLIEKIERNTLAFLDKKSIEKEAEWKVWPLEKFSGMYFCENRDLEKKTEFVFFSVMAVVSFWVRFTGEIDNLTINNYKACQT